MAEKKVPIEQAMEMSLGWLISSIEAYIKKTIISGYC